MGDITFDLPAIREHITVFTPLGIRFWDSAREVQVADGLAVTARPYGQSRPVIKAYRTSSGIYAFQGLPGLRDIEYPVENADGAPILSPPVAKRFVIQVVDEQRRFLPVVFGMDPNAFRVEAPRQGILVPLATPASPPKVAPGFYLFSAPTRLITPEQAIVRAQLAESANGRPAAYAVLEVRTPDGKVCYGLADERGCVAAVFPYPAFDGAFGGTVGGFSPPGSPVATPNGEARTQRWQGSLRVRYEPAALAFPPDIAIPDLASVFGQSPNVIWPTQGGPPVEWLPSELVFGQELVARTEGLSTLLVGPATSPI